MTQAEQISQAIATVERQISEAKSDTAKKVLAKKLERLKEDLKKQKPSLTTLPKARKTVKALNKSAFQELVAELSKKPEYAFLKTYSQERFLRDKARTAKPKGYRFKGDNDNIPTADQVKKGLKDGTVYYEGRPIHSDISREIRLKTGGNIASFDWKNFTLQELNEALPPDVEITYYKTPEKSYNRPYSSENKKFYTKKRLTISQHGEAIVSKGNENIYLDIKCYNAEDRNDMSEYEVTVYSKENHAGLKDVAKSLIEKMKLGGNLKADLKALWDKTVDIAKKGYDKTKEVSKKKIHDGKKAIAIDVINETKGKVGKTDKSELNKAKSIIVKKFADGGTVKFRKLAKSNNFDIIVSEGRFEVELDSNNKVKSIVHPSGERHKASECPIYQKYKKEINSYLEYIKELYNETDTIKRKANLTVSKGDRIKTLSGQMFYVENPDYSEDYIWVTINKNEKFGYSLPKVDVVDVVDDSETFAKGGGIKQSNVYEINGVEYLVSEPTMYNGKYTGWNCYKAVFEMKDGERHLNYDRTKTFGNKKWFKNEDILKGKIVEDYFAKGGGIGDLKYKYYQTYVNIKKGFDLVYFDDNSDIDGDFKGTYETIELAEKQAKKDGYTRMPIYNRYAEGGNIDSSYLGTTRIGKGHYGWTAKTTTKKQINGYDWEITTMKRSSGDLVSTANGGKAEQKEGYSTFMYSPFEDPSLRLISSKPKMVNEKAVTKQHEEALKIFVEKLNEMKGDKMATGGKVVKKVSTLLDKLKSAHIKGDNDKFDEISNEIHEISDTDGLTEAEYSKWSELREIDYEKRMDKYLKNSKMATGGKVGEKTYSVMHNVGKAKYVVNFHNGEKTYSDGSPFFDIEIFKNLKGLKAFTKKLESEGYKKQMATGGEIQEAWSYDIKPDKIIIFPADYDDVDSFNSIDSIKKQLRQEGYEQPFLIFKTIKEKNNYNGNSKMATGGKLESEYIVSLQDPDSGEIEKVNVMATSKEEAENTAIEESGYEGWEIAGVDKMATGGSIKASDKKFKEVQDLGSEQYYTRYFGKFETEKGEIELMVVATIRDLEDYVSEDELPKEGNFQLSFDIVPKEEFISEDLLEQANDEDSSAVSDDSLVNIVNYMGGLRYEPSEKVHFKTQEKALKHLMSIPLNKEINKNGEYPDNVIYSYYNRAGSTNEMYLDYMIGVSDKFFKKGGNVGKSKKNKYLYIPNQDISKIVLKSKQVIGKNRILDGAYVKGGKQTTKSVEKFSFPVGSVVWDKTHKRYGVVLNNFGNEFEGDGGEIRLDSDGVQPIFEYDKKFNRTDKYNLVPYGSKEDKGNGDLTDIKESGQRLIDGRKEKGDEEYVKYYQDAFGDVIAGKIDGKPYVKGKGSNHGKFGDDNPRLVNFDIDDLNPYEEMVYNDLKRNNTKASTLQVIINTVEGDYTQLSPKLAEIAEEQFTSDEWDEESNKRYFATGGNIRSDIERYKKQLISKAKSKGLYENFGQDEVRKLEDKYGYTSEVRAFDDWAMNFDLSSLKQYATGGSVSSYFNDMTESEILKATVVYDNGGETLDRYTVFTPDGSVFGMSETAGGFNQYVGDDSEIEKGSHLGKRLKSVPKEIKWAVLDRMKEEFAHGGSMYAGGGNTNYSYIERDKIDRIVTNSGKEYGSNVILDGAYVTDRVRTPKMSRTQFEDETYSFGNGGNINLEKHIWEGWTVGDFIQDLEPTFNQIMSGRSWQKPFTTKQQVKEWCMENQPYYKKHIPEVVNYFWAKVEGKYAHGGNMQDFEPKSEDMRATILAIQKSRINPADVSPNFAKEMAMDIGRSITEKEAIRIAKGFGYEGKYATGGTVGDYFYDTRKDKAFQVIMEDGDKMAIQYLDRSKSPIGKAETISKNEFEYYVQMGAWNKWKQEYATGGEITPEERKQGLKNYPKLNF